MSELSKKYLLPLQYWVKSLEKTLYFLPGRDDLACCGNGDHGHWSIQTNTTVFAALAVLSQTEKFDEKITGSSKELLLDTAMKILRYTLKSHKVGNEVALDGESWGCNWISSLSIERMMHAIEVVEPFLTDEDHQLIKNIHIAESNWLVDDYHAVGAIDSSTGKNHPESNIWNGNMLHRTAIMYPETPRVCEYRENGNYYLLNGISIPSDIRDDGIIDGKPIKKWHVGPNYTENYGLNHHGYLNVGYMVICLSNIAMMHFFCKNRSIKPPDALYHHVPELWKIIKLFTFPDGRLWRVGGDTRVRYAYCQDYAIPMWLMMRDKYGENCDLMEEGWLDILTKEQATNSDGSFMKERLSELEQVSPLYYHRLEGDKGVTLSMALYWRNKYNDFNETIVSDKQAPMYGEWSDSFHGAVVSKGQKRGASWVWEAAQRPMGQCVPMWKSDLTEWQWNLTGVIEGMGFYNTADIESHKEWKFQGGFCTNGSIVWSSDNHVAEGQQKEKTAREEIAVVALPDDATMIVFQRAKVINRLLLKSIKGLNFNVPNDVINNSIRKYKTPVSEFFLKGMQGKNEIIHTNSKSIEIDDEITISAIYGVKEISIYRPAKRQVAIFGNPATQGRSGGNLYCDEICHPCITNRQSYDENQILFDQGFVIEIGNSTPTAKSIKTNHDDVKAVQVTGADGELYVIVISFNDKNIEIQLKMNGIEKVEMICGNSVTVEDGVISCDIGARDILLMRIFIAENLK